MHVFVLLLLEKLIDFIFANQDVSHVVVVLLVSCQFHLMSNSPDVLDDHADDVGNEGKTDEDYHRVAHLELG